MTMSHHKVLLMDIMWAVPMGVILGLSLLYVIRYVMFKYKSRNNQDPIMVDLEDESYNYTPLLGEELLLFPVYSIS
jgi:hypothetical protein